MTPLPNIVIYTNKEIVTLNPDRPKATAVAVVGKLIINKKLKHFVANVNINKLTVANI